MTGCSAFRSLAAGAVLVLASSIGFQPAHADTALACAGLSSLSAIVETLRVNGIDPLVQPPGGVEPIAVALVPADSDAAQAAAGTLKLRRLEPGTGETREAILVPRRRPAVEQEPQIATEKPPKETTVASASAAAYRKFIADLKTIAKTRLDNPENLKRARQLLVKSSLVSLARGWVASCSEIAAKSQEFASGVDKAASQGGGPESFKSSIEKQPSVALNINGWQDAALEIRKVIAQDAALMASVAWRLSEVAYGRTGNEARLAAAANKGDFSSPAPPVPSPAPTNTLSARAKPIMAQMLALGAHMHLSKQQQTPAQPDPATATLATNKDNDQCLRWAMLNLSQCLAAAKDNQERAYCLGKQGIEERSNCWSWMVSSN